LKNILERNAELADRDIDSDGENGLDDMQERRLVALVSERANGNAQDFVRIKFIWFSGCHHQNFGPIRSYWQSKPVDLPSGPFFYPSTKIGR